jgi:hypothetical protein
VLAPWNDFEICIQTIEHAEWFYESSGNLLTLFQEQ